MDFPVARTDRCFGSADLASGFRRAAGGALLAASLLAAGCAAPGPDWQRPQPALPAGWAQSAGGEGVIADAPSADWWRAFGDPRLDALVATTLAQSPTLQAAAARVAGARAARVAAGAEGEPRVGFDPSAQRLRTSANAPSPLPVRRAFDGVQYQLPLTMSWELDLWRRIDRAVEAADAQALASRHALDAARLAVAAEVAATWLQWRGADDEVRVLGATLATRDDSVAIADARMRAGAANEAEGARARAERANVAADLADAARRRDLLVDALAMLSGDSPAALRARLGAAPDANAARTPGEDPSARPLPVVPPGLPAQLLARRPDLAESEAQLHAATARIGVAEAATRPALRLTGQAGMSSRELSTLLEAPSRLFSFGPALAVSLLDGGRRRADVDAARASADEAMAAHRGRWLAALREVDDALAELHHRAGQAAQIDEVVAQSRVAVEVARIRYRAGAAAWLEVADAERTLLAGERARAQVATARRVSTVQLVRALGGGWRSADEAIAAN